MNNPCFWRSPPGGAPIHLLQWTHMRRPHQMCIAEATPLNLVACLPMMEIKDFAAPTFRLHAPVFAEWLFSNDEFLVALPKKHLEGFCESGNGSKKTQGMVQSQYYHCTSIQTMLWPTAVANCTAATCTLARRTTQAQPPPTHHTKVQTETLSVSARDEAVQTGHLQKH